MVTKDSYSEYKDKSQNYVEKPEGKRVFLFLEGILPSFYI